MNFKTGPEQILSFRAQLKNTTTTSTLINLSPVGTNAGIIYLSFSIVIVTSNSSADLEIVTLQGTNLTAGLYVNLYTNSSNYNFTDEIPTYFSFYQWVTGEAANTSSTINYWTQVYVDLYSHSSGATHEIWISFWIGWDIYMTGVKINVVMVSPFINGAVTAVYYDYAYADGYSSYLQTNLGVNTSLFHPPETG